MWGGRKISGLGAETSVGEEDPRFRGDDGVEWPEAAAAAEPQAPVAEALEGVAAVTVSTEAEVEQAEAETPKPAWAPKVIGADEPVVEKKRGWWRR